MKRILTAKEMSGADAYTIETIGIPSEVLMERAALAVFREIKKRKLDTLRTLIVCGSGNNGGDGAAVARLLAEEGLIPDVLMLGNPEKYSAQLKMQLRALEYYDVNYVSDIEDGKYDLIIDAIFGIGLSRDITGAAADVIKKINAQTAYKVSVDVPSGIEGSTGHVRGIAVKADLTVTFACAKIGHFIYPGAMYSGETVVANVGIPAEKIVANGSIYHIEDSDIKNLPKRDEYGNKATFGKLLVIAGSANICGAAYFVAASALRIGAGMVKILTSSQNRSALSILAPEALIDTYDEECDESKLEAALSWADGVVIGPGLGTGDISVDIFNKFIELNNKHRLYTVMDADALNIIASDENYWSRIGFDCAVTPHIGEMSRLVNAPPADIKADPIKFASDLAAKHSIVCVMKDAVTVTSYPDDRSYINTSGCSALATAGSGDVLSGIIGGMMVSHRKVQLPLEAYAVHMHGRLGESAARRHLASSVTAGMLIEEMCCKTEY